jgi:hypothetical protein
MLEYNLSKKLEKSFHSFYNVEDYNIFVKTIVLYMCIQKQKYMSKII